MENLSIRKAIKEDLNSILKIKKQVHKLYAEKRPDLYKVSGVLYSEEFLKSFFENNKKVILVTISDNEIIAYSFLEFIDVNIPMMVERKYIYIHDFAVSKKYRNQGIASGLLIHIEEYAREKGALKLELAVHLFSQEAIKLYKKIGFTPRAVRMEKELDSDKKN
ncbi:MAG: GNAT family N-acetyltransferase [Clostridium sp.]|nr:GNAT family N-acetyltransferase [Clostridium sp.]